MNRVTHKTEDAKEDELVLAFTVIRLSNGAEKTMKVRVVEYKDGRINDIRELPADDDPRSIHNAVRRLSTLITGVR